MFRNLPGQPIEIGGANAVTVYIFGATFSGNTGGAADVLVSNTNAASRVYLIGCRSDRTLVSVTGSAVVENVPFTQGIGWTLPVGTPNKGAFGTYTTVAISATYSQAQVQALSDNLDAVSRFALAMWQDGQAFGLWRT